MSSPPGHSGAALITSIVAAIITGTFAIVAAKINIDAKHENEKREQQIEAMRSELRAKDLEIENLQRRISGGIQVNQQGPEPTSKAGDDSQRLRPSSAGSVTQRPNAPGIIWIPKDVVQPKPTMIDDFLIEARSCLLSGGELTCTLIITNTVEPRAITMHNGGDAYATFDNGKRVHQSSLSLGGSTGYDLYLGVTLYKAPTELVIKFAGVPDGISKVTLLDFELKFPQPMRRVQLSGIQIQHLEIALIGDQPQRCAGRQPARPSRYVVAAAHQQISLGWWERRRHDFDLVASLLVVNEARLGQPRESQ